MARYLKRGRTTESRGIGGLVELSKIICCSSQTALDGTYGFWERITYLVSYRSFRDKGVKRMPHIREI